MDGDGCGLLPRIDVLTRVMSSASKPVQVFSVTLMLECCKGVDDVCWTQGGMGIEGNREIWGRGRRAG
jgi:hypothetical protein